MAVSFSDRICDFGLPYGFCRRGCDDLDAWRGEDPATVRRFTFKVAFDYLKDEGKELFFERFFGKPLAERDRAELATIPDLAPGDFRTVRQSLHYLGGAAETSDLLRALREESEAKRSRGGRPRAAIGF